MTRYGDYTFDPNFEVPVAAEPPTQPAMPPSMPKRNLADLIERVAVHEVKPGDVLVFEINDRVSDQEHDELQRRIRAEFGDATLSIVINGKFGGVLRRKGDVLVEVTGSNEPRTYMEGNPEVKP